MDYVLAADIGGTKLAAGVVARDGRLYGRCRADTPRDTDAEALYATFAALLHRAVRESGRALSEIRAIGVGCGGPMLFPQGIVSPLNILAWRQFPLRARLEAHFDLPVVVDNDAKVFALGEYWLGTGRGSRCFMAMVCSTGVGGGVVERGRLIDGARGNAGHIGHVVVYPGGPACACGARGCLEAVASGTALASLARAAVARGVPTSVGPDVTAALLQAAALAGDPLAVRLFRSAGVGLGRAIASAAALFDLDRVVIGGGVSAAAPLFMPSLRRELDRRAQLDFARGLPVEISTGTIDAALAGAARLVLTETHELPPGAVVTPRPQI